MENIDIYYESLKQVNEQIILWRKQRAPKEPSVIEKLIEGLRNVFLVIFIISLIPILPALVAYLASKTSFVFGVLDLSQPTLQNFLKVWLIIGLSTGLIFFILEKINDKFPVFKTPNDEPPPQSLSSEQYTFIKIYQAYKELKMFFVDHFDHHLNNSLDALHQALLMIGVDNYDEALYFYYTEGQRDNSGLMLQILTAKHFMRVFEQYDWFMLDPKTKSILQALISFSEKILQRLGSREELPSVLEVLENLSKYLYAFLPEHKTYMNAETLEHLHTEGFESLSRFVDKANNMTLYQVPKKDNETRRQLSPSTLKEKFLVLYQNIFFRFALWFVIILTLTSIMVLGASQLLTLSPDAMATLIIGTSVGGAAALSTFLPKYPMTHNKESNDDDEIKKGTG